MKNLFAAAAALGVMTSPACAQDMADVQISAQQIAPGIAVLFGRGGNIGVSHGTDGTILIDDQYAPLTERIQAAIADLGAPPARFVVNTHWHGDHTGGNENLSEDGATIVAHDNVRLRLAEGGNIRGNAIPPRPDALPTITYDSGLTFHANGDTIDILFLGSGHTDGDSIVFWREDNVLHMGDLFFHEFGWPFIDVDSGGNALHLLSSLDLAIRMVDDETAIIPGHGPMASKADLVAYRRMVGEGVRRVRAAHEGGLTLEQTIAENPVDGLSGRTEAFISDEAFIRSVWHCMDAAPHRR